MTVTLHEYYGWIKNSRLDIIFLHNFETIVPLYSNFKVTNEKSMQSRFRTLWVCSAQKPFRIHFLARVLIFHKGILWSFLLSVLSPCRGGGGWVFYCGHSCPSVLEIQNMKFLWQNATFSFPVLFVKYLCWLNIWSPGMVIQISYFFVSFFISFYSTFLDFQFYLLFCFLLFLKSCFSYLGWFFFSASVLIYDWSITKDVQALCQWSEFTLGASL